MSQQPIPISWGDNAIIQILRHVPLKKRAKEYLKYRHELTAFGKLYIEEYMLGKQK